MDRCESRNAMYKTLNLCDTEFSNMYFSNDNINMIQNLLYIDVKKRYGYKIDKQSDNDLLIIMKGIFNLHGIQYNDIKKSINALNAIVVQKCSAMVESNVKMYRQYIKDASNLPIPNQRPEWVGNKDMEINSIHWI